MISQAQRVFVVIAFMSTVFLSAAAQAALTHRWDFEEPGTPDTPSTAPQVLDSAGSQHGNFVGMNDTNRSTDVPTGIGSTRSLNFGTDNGAHYVDLITPSGTYIDLTDNTDWSISLWYKGSDAGGADSTTRVLLGANASNTQLSLRTGGKVVYAHYDGSFTDNVISTVSVTDGLAWHNIVLVNHSNKTADLYVDALAQVTGASSIAIGTPFKIGDMMTAPGISGKGTSGLLDDVRIYNNALTENEVRALNNLPALPEPASLALLGVGGMSLLGRRRARAWKV